MTLSILQVFFSNFLGCSKMVKTTGGPAMGASVSSPAMTDSAVSLLQDNLNLEERQLWTSLGPNWTHSQSVPTHTTSLFSFFPNLNYIPYM